LGHFRAADEQCVLAQATREAAPTLHHRSDDGNMIVLDKVCKSFDDGATFAVQPLSLEVAEGETLVLLGSSGCGKTTTLKMINRLIEPTAGVIEVDGRDVLDYDPVELRRSIGYVFQGIGLLPRLLGWPSPERRERSQYLLELVGLPPAEYSSRFPDELSGGQQQRVGLARSLAADPAYLLMDEPFGALDALTRDTLQQELLSLRQQLGKTIIFVTHDIFEALMLADGLAILHAGHLEQVGTRDEVLSSPATPFVRNLFAKPAKQLAAFGKML
jgi:osmoprotectant transport system ATP-binding protein